MNLYASRSYTTKSQAHLLSQTDFSLQAPSYSLTKVLGMSRGGGGVGRGRNFALVYIYRLVWDIHSFSQGCKTRCLQG